MAYINLTKLIARRMEAAMIKQQRECEHRWEAVFTLDDDYAQCNKCGAREEINNVDCEGV